MYVLTKCKLPVCSVSVIAGEQSIIIIVGEGEGGREVCLASTASSDYIHTQHAATMTMCIFQFCLFKLFQSLELIAVLYQGMFAS